MKFLRGLCGWRVKSEPVSGDTRLVAKARTQTPVIDTPPVDREAYLNAWNHLVGTESGEIVVAHLRHLLWSEAGASCPENETIERVAMWQRKHEGRFEMLESILQEATMNVGLNINPVNDKLMALGRAAEPMALEDEY